MTTTVLGFKLSMPIMIAPTAMQKMAHPEGIQFLLLCLKGKFWSLIYQYGQSLSHHNFVYQLYEQFGNVTLFTI